MLDRKADYVGTYFKTALVTVLTTSIFLFCYLIDTATATALNDSAVQRCLYRRQALHPAHDERALQHQRGHVPTL